MICIDCGEEFESEFGEMICEDCQADLDGMDLEDQVDYLLNLKDNENG